MIAPYDPRTDAPVNVHHRPDCRCGLACEERDLREEAGDIDACLLTIATVLCSLYPPVRLGPFAVVTMNN